MSEKALKGLIRPVEERDAGLLLTIARETFIQAFASQNSEADMQQYLAETFTLPKMKNELREPDSKFYFVECNDQPAGYLKVNKGNAQTEKMADNALEIERIYLLVDYHGSGLAQQLVEVAVAVAIEYQCDYLWLGVWEENARAISFYSKLGFKVFGHHEFKLGQSLQTDILMKRLL